MKKTKEETNQSNDLWKTMLNFGKVPICTYFHDTNIGKKMVYKFIWC